MSARESGTPPSKLYRYRNRGTYTEKIFSDRALYFAAPGSFNDPFDCGFHILVDGVKNEAVTESVAWSLIKRQMPTPRFGNVLS